jgi:uroporphyrinogen decarboxylase
VTIELRESRVLFADGGLPPDHPLVDGRTVASPMIQALRGVRPAVLPVWLTRHTGRSVPLVRESPRSVGVLDSALNPSTASTISLQPVMRHGVDAAEFYTDIIVPLKLARVAVDIQPGIGPVLDRPYRTTADIERLTSRTLADAALEPIRTAALLVTAALGPTPLVGLAGAPFTLAAYLVDGRPTRDHLAARSLMHCDPESWDRLMAWCATVTGTFLRAQVQAGASVVQMVDPLAGLLSRSDYEHHVAPWSAQALSVIGDLRTPKDEGMPVIHSGVGTGHLLPAMREVLAMAGVVDGAVGVDYRTPIDEAAAVIGLDFPVQGNIDPAMLGAPWDMLAAHVRDVVERGAAAPGHIVNLGDEVPPDIDPAVLTRVVEFVHSLR